MPLKRNIYNYTYGILGEHGIRISKPWVSFSYTDKIKTSSLVFIIIHLLKSQVFTNETCTDGAPSSLLIKRFSFLLYGYTLPL